MPGKKKIIVVDDHDLFREGIKALLSNSSTIEVVADAKNGEEFLRIIADHNPDAVLMDISMPVMDGIEATRKGLALKPDLKVLAFSMFGDEENYYKMIHAGAMGFVLKSAALVELEGAIIRICENGNYFSEEVLLKIIPSISSVTERSGATEQVVASLDKLEIVILKLVVAGLSNEDIAHNLKISVQAVKSHRSGLLSKTSCRNSSSLGMYVIKNKIPEII